MRRRAQYVKRLACLSCLWHPIMMQKRTENDREARLAEALRANLRRRKASGPQNDDKGPSTANSPKSEG